MTKKNKKFSSYSSQVFTGQSLGHVFWLIIVNSGIICCHFNSPAHFIPLNDFHIRDLFLIKNWSLTCEPIPHIKVLLPHEIPAVMHVLVVFCCIVIIVLFIRLHLWSKYQKLKCLHANCLIDRQIYTLGKNECLMTDCSWLGKWFRF